MYNRLLRCLNNTNILVEELFGCRKNLTTQKAIHELINHILSVLNDKLIMGGIFSILARAYHCVNNDILPPKLNLYALLAELMDGSNHTLTVCRSYLKSYCMSRNTVFFFSVGI
jgi:hypothetical protein